MHKNIVAIVLSTVASTCMYGAEMASPESYRGDFEYNRSLRGHKGKVTSVAFSLNGESVVSGSNDKTARVWDLTKRSTQIFNEHTDCVTSVAWASNGKGIISTSLDKTIGISMLSKNESVKLVHDSAQGVTSVALNGSGLLACTEVKDPQLRIWSFRQKWEYRLIRSSLVMAHLCAVTFSPDGSRLATGSSTPEFWIWDCGTGTPTIKMSGHKQGIMSAKWDSSGQLLASASQDKTARVWDRRTGRTIQVLEGHDGSVNSVAWSPDGQRLVSGSDDKTAMVWDRRTDQAIQALEGHSDSINSVDWSRGEEKIVTGGSDREIFVWKELLSTSRAPWADKSLYTIEEEAEESENASLVPINQNQISRC